MTWEGLTPPYSTIVVDPPWDHSDGTGVMSSSLNDPVAFAERGWIMSAGLPYRTMTVTDIAALPVARLAAPNAHLYLWTTNRYLRVAYDITEQWGFTPSKPIIWCKAPKGPFMGGPYGGSSVEFCLFARRGNLRSGTAGRQWWEWRRGAHSEKPHAFLDVVEQVSPGPYVELFARSPRLGWDHWGYGYETSQEVS